MAAKDNPFYIEPTNIYDALMSGVGGYDRAKQAADQDQIDAALKQVGEQIKSGGISDSALGQLFALPGGKGFPGVTAAGHILAAKQAQQGFYGTPIWGTDTESGKTGVGTFNKMGQFKLIDTGSFQPEGGIKVISTPQGENVVQSKSGRPVSGGAIAPQSAEPQFGGPDTAPVRIPAGMTPEQVMQRYKPDTPIILSDGRQGVVPRQPQQQPAGVAPTQAQQPQSYYPKDIQGVESQKETGKTTAEKAATMGHAKTALDTSLNTFDRLETTARQIQNDPALGRITGMAGVFPNMPGGKAADLAAKVENLEAQTTVDVLAAMREASKTGGALGNVSNYEDKLLQSVLASTSQLQSKGAYKEAMQQIIDYSRGAKQRFQNAFNEDYGSVMKPTQSQTYPMQPPGFR